MTTVFVTTSWDDGHVLDERLADLLEETGVPGTFYVAPRNVELPTRERLSAEATRALSDRFEIGGHTLNHQRLARLSPDDAWHEVVDGKAALEEATGRHVTSFCYPGGAYGPEHPAMIERAGFVTARTVRRWVTRPTSAFEMATTMHGYRHLLDGAPILRAAHGRPRLAARLYANWDDLAIRLFNRVAARGGIYHLWGHSWEIDRNGDWERLGRVLRHIGRREGIAYVTNTELAERTCP